MPRVLVLSHTTGYQLHAFDDAAEALGIELAFATDRCHHLDDPWQDRAIPVRFFDVDASVAAIARYAEEFPINGLIAVGDQPVVLAARAAEALGLPWHSADGARASSDKRRSRAALVLAGLPSPPYVVVPASESPQAAASRAPAYPCVLKPVGLSGSRGVIRANDEHEFADAFTRINALLARPQIRVSRTGVEEQILVEQYIEGREFALEGVMTAGRLRVFALFDKPDPMEGPFFEETIYVTPSRLDPEAQRRVSDHVQRAASAFGLHHGPVHAEFRVTAHGDIYVLEIAARPIGGLCSRVLNFHGADGAPVSLESVLLQHAIGRSIDEYQRESRAAAVMMIPIPERGTFRGVSGEDRARELAGEVHITARRGQAIEPLPEAGSYLGFIFAHGASVEDVETAVRSAHQHLDFDIAKPIVVTN
jgi:biotin carboxylase